MRLFKRRQQLRLDPFTGPASCGCRFLNGDLMVPCQAHPDLALLVNRVGRHRGER